MNVGMDLCTQKKSLAFICTTMSMVENTKMSDWHSRLDVTISLPLYVFVHIYVYYS